MTDRAWLLCLQLWTYTHWRVFASLGTRLAPCVLVFPDRPVRQYRREAQFALPPWLWYTAHPSHVAFRWNRTGHAIYKRNRL